LVMSHLPSHLIMSF